MKKWKELLGAFRHLPALFRLIVQTDRLYLVYLLCETLCFAALSYPSVFLVRYAFNAMEANTPFAEFALHCSALILLQLAVALLKSKFNSLRPARTSLVVGRLYNAFHRKSMEMDYQLLAEKEIQEMQVLAGELIRRRLNGIVWNFVSLFSSLLAFAFSCGLLLQVNGWLMAAVVAGLVLDSAAASLFLPQNAQIGQRVAKIDRYGRYYEEATVSDAAKDLRIFHLGKPFLQRLDACNRAKFQLLAKKGRYEALQGLLRLLISHLGDAVVYGVLGLGVLRRTLSLGDFSLAIANIALFRQYFGKISSTLVGYLDAAQYIEYYNRFMSLESHFRKTGCRPVALSAEKGFSIEFRDVSFRYPGQSDYALRHFSAQFHSGEKISVVGENGAGKTTFVKLLMRLYDPTEGAILVDGVNIQQYDYDQYLALFAPIFQDFKLFAFTVEENVSAFEPGSLAAVQAAAQKAGINRRIEELPAGYGTYVTKQFDETGVDFSGGEQQKLALARTYYKAEACITILDEPTSALDPKAEYAIYRRFQELIGGNTAFFISHRLSSARFCDKILVIQNGALREFGSHQQLLEQDGYYASLYRLQAGYYQ